MSDSSPANARRGPGRHIDLPTNDTLMPRREFAKDVLGVTDKTALRMNLPTTYIGNVAHVLKNESLRMVAARAQRSNQKKSRE
jgi:hypothetical protein